MEELKDFVKDCIHDQTILAVATLLGATGVIFAIVAFPIRWWSNRRRSPQATKADTDATEQPTIIVGRSGGPTIVVHIQPSATANFIFYVDGLPSALAPTRDHFIEGERLQEADRHDEAIKEFQTAFASADTNGQRGALHALMGISQIILGRLAQAEGSFREALRLFQSAQDNEGQGAALGNLGIVYADRGELDRAEDHYRQALKIHREIGNRLGEARQLGNLGNVYEDRGDLEKAEEHHKQALEIDRDIGNRLGEAQDLGNLGIVYADCGELDRAEDYYKQALKIHREIGNRLGEARQLGNLSSLRALRLVAIQPIRTGRMSLSNRPLTCSERPVTAR